jgi:DNA-binding Xre family transcriptional regulator
MDISVPRRYLPLSLSKRDKKEQAKMLAKSRKLYKRKQYYTRKKVKSFHSKKSNHILNARKTYKIDSIMPSEELSQATGCSIASLQKIVNKGEGAYFSSGSRPNQTAQSWGIARLASAITAGKAAAVDYDILKKGCDHKKKAFMLANKARKMYNHGRSRTAKVNL